MNQYCPITGLKVFSRPEWINKRVSDTFVANFYVVGNSIIYSFPEGKADLTGVRNSLALNDEVAKHVSGGTGAYIQIEDYAAMTGATQPARNYFLNMMDADRRRQSLIFCNLSLPLSIAVKIGNRFITSYKYVHVAKHYKAAIERALELCDQEDLERSFVALDRCFRLDGSERSLTPIDLFYNEEWDIQTPEYSSRFIIIDKSILYSISEGYVGSKHLPLIERTQSMFQTALPAGTTIDYIVADVSRQTGVSLSMRSKYMQLLRAWHQQYPFRLYILFGDNRFMRSAALLPRPFLPFSFKFARDCSHAFDIIREDRLGIPAKKQRKPEKVDPSTLNQENIVKLSTFIANINWEEEGVDSSIAVSEQDPFFVLFESINLVKEELDHLIADRRRVEEALQASNAQLQDALSELQQTQEKMVQQERLAAVGQLAAGISHDFNNILASILGYAELLQLSPDTPEAMQPKLKIINDSGVRAAHLVRQLLDFSRKTIRKTELLNLAASTMETTKFFERTIPENVQISLDFEPEAYYLIEADPIQLQQMITNLAVNARDAMPTGGELRIGLSQIETTDDSAECVLCDQAITGDWIRLEISDSGSGISPDVLPRIFEPFFTTKAVGDGAGLGLSQVAGIVSQHNGHIMVESQVGEGTAFAIYLLPASGREVSKSEPAQLMRGEGETVLLVEDEPMVLEATTAALEYLGYQVVSAVDGRDALAAFQEHGAEIDLVLSDLIMPEMAGEELFHALKQQNPDVQMIMMSGYPLGEQGASLLEQGIVTWVQKPIPVQQLSQVVGEALSNSGERWDS